MNNRSRHPQKRLGQHWLRSEAVLQAIVAAAEIGAGDRILEIGPGTGILTEKLLQQAESVTAVEVDRHLCETLRQQFQAAPNFHLIESDILALDLSQPPAHDSEKEGETIPSSLYAANKVVANIPYYITGPILELLLGTIARPRPNPYDAIVLLVQKEVAERICADPGSKIFGALSVRVQYLATCEWVCTVPAKAFFPPPKVDSAVVKLMPRPFQPAATSPQQFETLVKAGFGSKRKMLRNNLKGLVDRDRLLTVLSDLHIKPEARAEEISVQDWVELTNRLIHP